MDREIVDALLRLLDQRVAIDFPCEFLGDAIDLFKCLIDRHRADRHRRIADDPFARVVNVAARGEVHDIVRAPADRPHHLVDFFRDRGGDGGIADIGIDLHEEIAADNHRLEFRMIDIRGDDGPAGGDFGAHEFRRDEFGDIGAEALALGNLVGGIFERRLAAHILALGDERHFGGDDTGLRKLILRDGSARQTAARTVHDRESAGEMFLAGIAIVFGLHLAPVIKLRTAARLDPCLAVTDEAFLDVDLCRGVRIGAGGVIDADRRLLRGGMQRDFPERHLQFREAFRRGENLGAGGKRAGGDVRQRVLLGVNVHSGSPLPALLAAWKSGNSSGGGGPLRPMPVPSPA